MRDSSVTMSMFLGATGIDLQELLSGGAQSLNAFNVSTIIRDGPSES